MSKGHRLFFALVPGHAIIDKVKHLQQSLNLPGRAARPQQFHATLAFLGLQQAAVIPQIKQIASELSFRPCSVALDRYGQFKRAGVFWLGASEVPAALDNFQQSLVGSLLAAGIGYDRKAWIFHLTLYRKLRKPAQIMDPVAIEWPLNGFHLVESVSMGNRVEYHSIGHWKSKP